MDINFLTRHNTVPMQHIHAWSVYNSDMLRK